MFGMLAQLLTIVWAGLIGWGSGALINYLADVLPEQRRLGRTICPACHVELSVGDYAFWWRACRACGQRRALRNWLVGIVSIVAATLLHLVPHPQLRFAVTILLYTYFCLVMVIDLEHRLILHPVSLAGGVLAFAVGMGLHGTLQTFLGGAAGFGLMLGLYLLGNLFARLMARLRQAAPPEDALGFGDVMLAGVIGFLLGWPGIIAGLLLTILLGGAAAFLVVIIMLLGRSYRPFTAIPYGPFLVIAAVVLLYGRGYLIK
jgi:leader peptidase (prepilin peptidase)/N-methyltransferase